MPVTFYTSVDQLPNFEDYGMANRPTATSTPSHSIPCQGLSYTTFKYSDLTVPSQPVAAGQPVGVDATVTNTGKVAGDEVVQVYLKFPTLKGAPLIAFADFKEFISNRVRARRFTST